MKKIVIFLLLFSSLAKEAYGYIDPGTGSFLLQILIAIIATSIYAIKYFWASIKRFFSKIFGKKKKTVAPSGKRPRQQPMSAKSNNQNKIS